MNDGFVKISRKLITWEWYDDVYVKGVFIHCLLMANWKDGKWHGHKVKRGQFITSKSKLAIELGLDRKTITRALDVLEASGAIKKKTNKAFTIITVCKYNEYQNRDNVVRHVGDSKDMVTDNNTDNNTDTIEERKERKNSLGKESQNYPSFDEVKAYALDRGASEELALDFYEHYESNGWMVGKNPMKNWKASFNGWMRRHMKEVDKEEKEVEMNVL